MKKLLLSVALILSANAENLKSILDYAITHNELALSKDINSKQPLLESESLKKDYFPKVYIGGAYQRLDPLPKNIAGDTYNAFAKVSINLYDGNKKKYQIQSKKYLFNSLKFESKSYKKQLEFNIVNIYFNIKSLKSQLQALKSAKKYLSAEYERVENKYKAGMVTIDEVKKIEASLFNTIYQIDKLNYSLNELENNLNLYTGKDIKKLDDSRILPINDVKIDTLDNIKSLKEKIKELEYNAKSLDSIYKPQIKLEDSYSVYKYDRDEKVLFEEDNQNKLTLSLNILIFDNSSVKKQKQSILIQKLALQKQIAYYKKQQNKDIKLALLNIKTIKSQIKSAKKSLESANIAFDMIANKYHIGEATVVDYLDALNQKTNALAQYKTALNELQIAYANYYLNTNNDIINYVKVK